MALRALDGSANSFGFMTTLKVVPGADDNFAIGCWFRSTAYEPTPVVFPRIFQWKASTNWDYTQAQIITGSDSSPSVYWDRRNVGTISSANAHSGACDGKWRFSIFRAVSTSNHRAATIDPVGQLYLVSSAVDVSTLDTSLVDTLHFGWGASVAKHDVAEFWIAAGDPFKGFTDIPRDLMYYIAYNGPYAYAPIRERLQFYASFEDGINCSKPGHYIGAPPLKWYVGSQTGNRATSHPPIAPDYFRPSEFTGLNMM